METEHINWNKEALDFFVNLYPVKREKDIVTIRTTGTQLLQRHAHAASAAIIRLDDMLTARVLYSSNPALASFVDAKLIGQVVSRDAVVPESGSALGLPETDKLFFLPVNEKHYAGAFLLTYPKEFEAGEDFLEFLKNARIALQDITMLVQTYYSIEQLTTRFNAILTNIAEGIVFVDDRGKEGWVNPTAAELLDIQASNNSAVAIAEAMYKLRTSAINHEAIAREGAVLFSSPNQTIKDWIWIFGNPVNKVLNVSCVPTLSDNVNGRLWVFTDITAMHLATEQMKELNLELEDKRRMADEQNMAKSAFLANMSHEIRTPMNGVIGMTSLLHNTELNDEQKEYVDTIRISGETLLSIINDILDFSKIESGKMELESEPFRIDKLIEETYDLQSVKANEKGIDLLYYTDPGVPTEIVGDVTRVRQILNNLVSNGLKFTEQGEILITVNTLNVRDDEYTLEFTVKDTGIGIPRDKFHRLFESFSQVDSSTTRKYGGTGLGLTISQRLVQMMGGSIRVESEPGKGSSFIFTIKAKANRKAIRYSAKEKISAENVLKEKTVLLLDDNKTNLRILSIQLGIWGMNVITTDNYFDALVVMNNNHFDVAILDMMMPGKSGVEVAHMMRERDPRLPLVLFSSAGYMPLKDAANDNLFAAILNKPLKHLQMRETLSKILGNATQEVKEVKVTEIAGAQVASEISILVAEDDIINQKLIGRALEKLGHTYDMVNNGLKAVESMQTKRYQLIFMDMMMPEMDGFEASKIILEQYHGKEQPIIVALTANALAGDRERILAHGMHDYISKPYKIQDIQTVIEKWEEELKQKK